MNSTATKNLEKATRIAKALDRLANRSNWSDPADIEVSYHVCSGKFRASAWVDVNGRERRWESLGETVGQALNALEVAVSSSSSFDPRIGGRR